MINGPSHSGVAVLVVLVNSHRGGVDRRKAVIILEIGGGHLQRNDGVADTSAATPSQI